LFSKYFFQFTVNRERSFQPQDIDEAFRYACRQTCFNHPNAAQDCIDHGVCVILMRGDEEVQLDDFEGYLDELSSVQSGLVDGESSTRNWHPNASDRYGQREITILKLLWTTRGTPGLPRPGGGELQETVVNPNVVPQGYDPRRRPTLWLVDRPVVEHWFTLLGMRPRRSCYLGDVFGPNPRFPLNRNVIVFKLAQDRLNDADGHGRELVLWAHELLFRVCWERDILRARHVGSAYANSHEYALNCMVLQYDTIATELLGFTNEETYKYRAAATRIQSRARVFLAIRRTRSLRK